MNVDRMTQRVQEALNSAYTRALSEHHTQTSPEHLLVAILDQPDGIAAPILGWFAGHQRENAELAADRAAIEGVGRPPLARALLSLTPSNDPDLLAAFTGSAELRAAQVLGDPLPSRRPNRTLWLASTAGVISMSAVVGCLAPLMLNV